MCRKILKIYNSIRQSPMNCFNSWETVLKKPEKWTKFFETSKSRTNGIQHRNFSTFILTFSEKFPLYTKIKHFISLFCVLMLKDMYFTLLLKLNLHRIPTNFVEKAHRSTIPISLKTLCFKCKLIVSFTQSFYFFFI